MIKIDCSKYFKDICPAGPDLSECKAILRGNKLIKCWFACEDKDNNQPCCFHCKEYGKCDIIMWENFDNDINYLKFLIVLGDAIKEAKNGRRKYSIERRNP